MMNNGTIYYTANIYCVADISKRKAKYIFILAIFFCLYAKQEVFHPTDVNL